MSGTNEAVPTPAPALTEAAPRVAIRDRCKTAVVLAAGPASALGAGLHGRTSAAMVPVSGQPILHRTLTYLHDLGFSDVVIGARTDDYRLRQFVETRWSKRFAIRWVMPDANRGPGYTLLCCLRSVTAGEPCLVVLGDTSFRFADPCILDSAGSVALTSQVDEPERWCLAESDGQGRVRDLTDKPAAATPPYVALIGVYYLHDSVGAVTALDEQASTGAGTIEISTALRGYIADGALRAVPAAEWIDVGNPDKLAEARRHLIAPRSFNSLTLDAFRGTITKRSQNTAKFLAEIEYYGRLPERLRVFFPRVLSAATDVESPFVELEYYGYPTLSELWTFEDLGSSFWGGVVTKLGALLDAFAESPTPLDGCAVAAFYRDKTLSRMEEAVKQSDLAPLTRHATISINGIRIPGLPSIAAELPKRLATLKRGVAGRVIHGDLCFPNILFDRTLGLFRLIDPRGMFLTRGVDGDGRLDAAKLLHSVEGGYDLVINDLLSVAGDGPEFAISIPQPSQRIDTERALVRMLGERFDIAQLRLIESTLFLSMAVLHTGHQARQTAMLLIGALLYHGALDDANLYRY